MKIAIPSLLLFAGLTATHPATVLAVAPPAAADQGQNDTANNDFSFVRYRADYRVNANATNVKTESYEVLLRPRRRSRIQPDPPELQRKNGNAGGGRRLR